MKTKTLLSFVLTALVSFTAYAGDNLLTNGDFEIFETKDSIVSEGWVDAKTNNELEMNADAVINGAKCIRFSGAGTGSWLTRTVDVEAGETYTFTFTGRIHDAWGASGSATTKVGTLYGRVAPGGTKDWVDLMSTQSNVDTTLSADFTIPAGITQLKVQIWKNKKIAWVDDLSFIKKESTHIQESTSSKIKIFVTNHHSINIESPEMIKSYAIYSISGSMMAQKSVNSTSVSENILSQGIYLVKVQAENGQVSTQKVIIK